MKIAITTQRIGNTAMVLAAAIRRLRLTTPFAPDLSSL